MRLAVFTIVRNEAEFLPLWVAHYSRQVDPSDLYVLDHESTGTAADVLEDLRQQYPLQVLRVTHRTAYDSRWLAAVTQKFQHWLLQCYPAVLFSAADELVVPTPESGQTLLTLAEACVSRAPSAYAVCNGFEVIHRHDTEPPLELQQDWLAQRDWWSPSRAYSKPLLSSVPLYWRPGWFGAYNVQATVEPLRELLLLHLHKIDLTAVTRRHQQVSSQPWDPEERARGCLRHNLLEDPERLSRWILASADDSSQYAELRRIPASVKRAVSLCV